MKRALAVALSSLLMISIFVIIPGFPKAHGGTFPGVNGKIAFYSWRDGHQQIYVVNPDGTSLTNLSNNENLHISPSWSPDGTKIAFSGCIPMGWPLGCQQAGIWVMNADGTNQINIVDNHGGDPSWSPDGTKIAFTINNYRIQIWVMNA